MNHRNKTELRFKGTGLLDIRRTILKKGRSGKVRFSVQGPHPQPMLT